MRIERIESWREAVRLTVPYSIAGRTFDTVELLFLRIVTNDGKVGLGSASPADFVTGETVEACAEALGPERLEDLVGGDPRDLAGLTRRLGDSHHSSSDARATPAARAAVEMALWDLHAHSLETRVVDLLGLRHDGLPTSITLGISPVDETLAEARERLAQGFRHLKIKLGDDLEMDLERLRQLNRRLGAEIRIRVDANQGYGRAEAERLLSTADELDLELIEQPLPRGEDRALRDLPHPRAPLAADESLHDPADALIWAEEGSPYGIFNIKLMKCGGIGPARAISAVTDTSGQDLMWGCMDESRISIAAALAVAYSCPRTRYLDLDGAFDLASDPAVGGFELREGRLFLVDQPGLGVRLRA